MIQDVPVDNLDASQFADPSRRPSASPIATIPPTAVSPMAISATAISTTTQLPRRRRFVHLTVRVAGRGLR
ncbi:hypothetical protein ACPA9J_34765 [Pseudomonas aeruginosa]